MSKVKKGKNQPKIAEPQIRDPQQESSYAKRMKKSYLEAYIRNKLNGNYHATRCKAILEQIDKKQFGIFNGLYYNEDCLKAEFLITKHTAVKSFAGAQTCVVELIKLGMTHVEIDKHYNDFLDASTFFKQDEDFQKFSDGDEIAEVDVARFVDSDDGPNSKE